MKTQFIAMGMVMAGLATATAFADDAQTQMNGQMGQTQAQSGAPTQAAPSQDQSTTDNSAAGSSTSTTTTTTTNTPATPAQ